MRTVKWIPFLSGVCTVLGGALLWVGAAKADVTSTNPAAILIFPKLLIEDTAASFTNTIIQLTNTADTPVNLRCYYVNANGHCAVGNFTVACDPFADPATQCGGTPCVGGWVETDFQLRLTGHQPIAWDVKNGLPKLPLNDQPGPAGEFNFGSVPPFPESPLYLGELKCIQVGEDERPIDRNDIKGEATIEKVTPATGTPTIVDSRTYNAIGVLAIEGRNNNDNILILGPESDELVEYNGCPNVLIMDHFFDGSPDPTNLNTATKTIWSHVTLAPCSEDFAFQTTNRIVVQYLVYNEFEQRFSTSKAINCLAELHLSDIDTRLGPSDDLTSIFNIAVEGTLTGQTLIRGVDNPGGMGEGLVAIVEEFHSTTPNRADIKTSAAFVTHQRGVRQSPDIIALPEAAPTGQ